jgi:hypothetical protein
MDLNNTKKCPYCAEPIKLEAIKCKHCGSSLMPTEKVEVKVAPQKREGLFLQTMNCACAIIFLLIFIIIVLVAIN